jgi:ribokinase
VARVGNDPFGPQAIRAYQAEGIDVSYIKRDENQSTGSAGILVDDDAENCIIAVPGANGNLSPQDVRDASGAIKNAHAVLCQLETPLDATLEAFRIARSVGVKTVLTPAPVQELPDELLTLCDLCMPNRTEMELLTKCPVQSLADAETAAKQLRPRGVKTVAMTMGAQGAFLLDDVGAMHIPALSVNAVDPTGAGDSFTAALAVSLAGGMSLKEAALRARIVAAITVTRVGAQSAFPTLDEVEHWLCLGGVNTGREYLQQNH